MAELAGSSTIDSRSYDVHELDLLDSGMCRHPQHARWSPRGRLLEWRRYGGLAGGLATRGDERRRELAKQWWETKWLTSRISRLKGKRDCVRAWSETSTLVHIMKHWRGYDGVEAVNCRMYKLINTAEKSSTRLTQTSIEPGLSPAPIHCATRKVQPCPQFACLLVPSPQSARIVRTRGHLHSSPSPSGVALLPVSPSPNL
jgi:hypothetical protein